MEKYDDESSKRWEDVFKKLFSEFSESEDGFVFDTSEFTTDFKKLISQQQMMNDNLKDLKPNSLTPGMFVQRLDDDNSKEQFNQIVKENDLSLDVDIITKNGRKIVIEKWSNKELNMKKVYPLSEVALSHANNETQLAILEKQLQQALIVENYEEATELRDRINELK